MKSLLQKMMIVGIACSMSITAFAAPIKNEASWATDGISKAYDIGLVHDSLGGNADDNISRKDFALLALQLYSKITGKEAMSATETPFTDMDLPQITFAYEQGIMSGRTQTEFFPDQIITREQMAVVIINTMNAAKIPLKDDASLIPFVDISTLSDSSKNAIGQLYSSEIISGAIGYYYPQKAVTLQEAILAFLNAYEYSNTVVEKLADSTTTPSSEAAAKESASEATTTQQLNAGESTITTEPETEEQIAPESSIIIGNKTITMGQTAREVRQTAGVPDRVDQDSNGFTRYVYLNGYADLFFVSIDENEQVVEIYTGSDNFEYMGIKGSESKNDIQEIKFDDKKNSRIELPVEAYDVYILPDHEEAIEGILIRDKSIRSIVNKRYNQTFERSTMRELLDLMNQARARQDQPPLTWDVVASNIGTKHCFNMSKNSFVEYNDNTGKTPFDRMTEGGLEYSMAAEISGKYSGDAINVYHEWMRNIGTRSNVLNSSLTHGGVGIYMDNYDMYVTADLFTP